VEYLIWCDESNDRGDFFSNFYGGTLVSSKDYKEVKERIDKKKEELYLKNEIKWSRVSDNYLEKYKSLMDTFFELVKQNKIKIRIMFIQNRNAVPNRSEYHKDNKYFLLYYQFIKHSFGLRHISTDEPINLRLYFDKLPDNKGKIDNFKEYLLEMQNISDFLNYENSRIRKKIKIEPENIAEIDSKSHSILQCLDVVLGSMNFKLNKLNIEKDPVTGKRGKRTIAKENLYKHILKHIRSIYPNFNIGISTGRQQIQDLWNHSYRHWSFRPKEAKQDEE
jgi:hypothetical protein